MKTYNEIQVQIEKLDKVVLGLKIELTLPNSSFMSDKLKKQISDIESDIKTLKWVIIDTIAETEEIKPTVLKAITYSYTQDGILHNKVVGIFEPNQLEKALDTIKKGFGLDKKIIKDEYDESCDNYFIEYDDDDKSYFYTSNYEVGEIYL